jgi:hypothetical protein
MKRCSFPTAVAILLILASSVGSLAAIAPITSVEAGTNGSPPYELTSVTVGDYSVTSDTLATGRSTGTALFGFTITAADNFDLNNFAARHSVLSAWQVTKIGGRDTWTDTNGGDPDFFIFEVGMNDHFTAQAILPDGQLGQAVSVARTLWGDTGLRAVSWVSGGQPIGGLAFAITDLLDADGLQLTNKSAIRGIQINSGTLDPAFFGAVVPEPATFAILGLGAVLALRRRRAARRAQAR